MRTLSEIGSPWPRLVRRASAITPEALERMEAGNAPELSSHVITKTKAILVLGGRIAREQTLVDGEAGGDNDFRQRILGDVVQPTSPRF